MDARTLSIRTIFGQDRRHIVPLYQRPYVWRRALQWEPLWQDIQSVAGRRLANIEVRPHFMGAVVFDQIRKPTGSVESRFIIDGQQRLTTIQLLLEAFADICASSGMEKHHRALVKLTRNDDPMSSNPEDIYKVWPTNVDQEHFRRVMDARSPDELKALYGRKAAAAEVGHQMADAYLYFHAVMSQWLSASAQVAEDRVDALLYAIRESVRMVVIDLDAEDDPQLIFETLNARGTPLLPSDLVKNYLFHKAAHSKQDIDSLYEAHWKPFDAHADYWRVETGRGHARRPRIDLFLQHYLTLRIRDEVPVAHLYSGFRQYADGPHSQDPEGEMRSLSLYASIFKQFDTFQDESRITMFFRRLAAMDITTAYPFLLELFRQHGRASTDMIREVLVQLESFLIRRMVCQLSTRGYNRLFIDVLATLDGNSEALSSRVRAHLTSSDAESTRWPDDMEFRRSWLATPLYRLLLQERIRMLLQALEMQLFTDMSEKIEFKVKLTIEHLMPQDWTSHWPLPQEGDQDEAKLARQSIIHTIGNLTLLTNKLNPSISNGPWEDKRSAILANSALALNRRLQQIPAWDETQIVARGEHLFDVARILWPSP